MRGRIALAAVLCLLAAGIFVGMGALPASAGGPPDPTQPCDPEFTGTSGDDVIFGDDGDNVLCGRAGNDKLFAGEGFDVLKGQDGNDQLFSGDDWAWDYLLGGRGADRLVPVDDTNTLNGGPGHDEADYSFNDCAIDAFLFDGVIYKGKCGTDSLDFGGGLSTVEDVTGTVWFDSIEGDVSANVLMGGASDDEIHGRGGEDSLYGQLGDDALFGEGGNDYLNGGDQSTVGDVCFGGAGTNTIVNCFP
ncbi:MAG TPA: hypothetical protein VEO00_00065 [Actinomycetota bacterium]|nr:hypothetical protein [Actinomycetota bacterium]